MHEGTDSTSKKQERVASLYKLRHLVENAFLHLKRWRGVVTRYAELTSSLLAAVDIRYITRG